MFRDWLDIATTQEHTFRVFASECSAAGGSFRPATGQENLAEIGAYFRNRRTDSGYRDRPIEVFSEEIVSFDDGRYL
ncbi:MAG: hypothetical protein OXF07_08375 [Rhodobacter sp.]|nr:hypothetical protein [Rhodobacter sp.]